MGLIVTEIRVSIEIGQIQQTFYIMNMNQVMWDLFAPLN